MALTLRISTSTTVSHLIPYKDIVAAVLLSIPDLMQMAVEDLLLPQVRHIDLLVIQNILALLEQQAILYTTLGIMSLQARNWVQLLVPLLIRQHSVIHAAAVLTNISLRQALRLPSSSALPVQAILRVLARLLSIPMLISKSFQTVQRSLNSPARHQRLTELLAMSPPRLPANKDQYCWVMVYGLLKITSQ